ncbi:hypothetical protein [Escherichia phage vB_EcoM_011D4]|uniref:Uncharacterized protein n=2 Tax=Krischvirus TaxID=1913651 RepID=A0A7D7JQF1_9CAUD|nr:hypothetical protein [Escherichia phage E26]QMP82554.1 hypothetical protein [Escherichia phage vB_EcoM_011D4]
MATVWLLIAISNSMYNYGNMSSIEFSTKQDCVKAREIIREDNKRFMNLYCVEKQKVN